MDPKSVRPRRDWILVLMEPRKIQLESGLLLPQETGAEKVTEGAGHVVRVGVGEKIETIGLKVGDRILLRSFLKHANPVETEEVWEDGRKKEYFLMSVDDIMSVISEETDVGVFSHPSQNKAISVDGEGRVKELR